MKRSWRSHVDNEKGDASNSRVGMGSSGWEDSAQREPWKSQWEGLTLEMALVRQY